MQCGKNVTRSERYLIQQTNLECGIVVQENAKGACRRCSVQGDLAHAQVGAHCVHCCSCGSLFVRILVTGELDGRAFILQRYYRQEQSMPSEECAR